MNIAITTESQDPVVRLALRTLAKDVRATHTDLDDYLGHMPVGGDRTATAGWIDVLDELSEALAVALGETGDGT